MANNYIVGLDIGITSVGFAIIDRANASLVEMGVRHFESAEEAKTGRLNRGARRLLDRKKWRKKQLKDAFVDFGLIDKETIKQNNYLSFTYSDKDIKRPKDDTVYHLRKRALKEKVTMRELLLALYNICKTRGHFLLENVDFEGNNAVTFDEFKEKYYAVTEQFIDYVDDRDEFEKKILYPIFDSKLRKANDIKSKVRELRITSNDNNDAVTEFLKLICGFSGDLTKITDDPTYIGELNKATVTKIKSLDAGQETDFLSAIVELYDLIQIHSILSNHEYLCEAAVEKLDKLVKTFKEDPDAYAEYKKEIQAKMNGKFDKTENVRVVKNLDNAFPNGLYVKEAKAILYKQQEEYGKDVISNEFIEVVASIISARIPFYIGPLSKDAKNAWITDKKHPFKYSYQYTQDRYQAIDIKPTIKAWKERMISHCTYLPDEPALPKGSFIYETYSILNEMNIYYAEDHHGDTYALTYADKVLIFDYLFLKNDTVSFSDVCDLLNLKTYGPRNNNKIKKFNAHFSLYHQISKILPELKVNSIKELYSDPQKIEKLESIILDISLFDEEKARKDYFLAEYGEDKAESLGKLKVKGFYSLSKAFLMNEPLNVNGESMMDILFSDNDTKHVNEQMTIITNATDLEGKPKNLTANKYYRILENNGKHLGIDLLIDGNKPVIPISRPVLRGLNECFKVYEEIIKVYGVPDRLVIETAKDFGQPGDVKKKHKDTMKELYDDIEKQLKTKKEAQLRSSLEDWDTIENYLANNKQKVELYIRQLGVDLLDGKKIDITRLSEYQIDHILPRGFGDDSMDDKMLISNINNALKGNSVPLEFIEKHHTTTTSAFKTYVDKLLELNLISPRKKERLMLESTEDIGGFINQNLVDTRYIIKEFTSIITAYNAINNYETHVVSLKSNFTNLARKAFGLKKNRDFGLQHHAHDACMIAIADTCLNTYYPHYDSRGNYKAYENFVNGLINNEKGVNTKGKDKNILIFHAAYQKAFGQHYKFLINDIKQTVPLYSEKVLKKGSGQYFNTTLKKAKDNYNEKDVLAILGINHSGRVYSSVATCAIDFYRYTVYDKKIGKYVPKHVAIHIPKVIVDKNGNIDENWYKLLVKEYYKADALLDDDGNIKEYFFRFRVFKNDIIYDTLFATPQILVGGSMAHKQLEIKHIDIYSYSDIYDKALLFFKWCLEYLNISDADIVKIRKMSEEDVKGCALYILNGMGITDKEMVDSIVSQVSKLSKNFKNNLWDLTETLSYYYLSINKPNIPNKIEGRYVPAINKTEFKGKENIEYIKLKYSPLGFRFEKNNNGNLVISGPRKNEKAFSKIRKEKFSWKISKYSL